MKRNRLLLSVIIVIFLNCSLKAQSYGENAVFLKSGSILYGKILEENPGKDLKLEIIGNNILVLPYNDIEKIIKSEPKSLSGEYRSSPIEISPAYSFYGGTTNSQGFTVISSYYFPFHMSTGLGLGVEKFNYHVLPVFAELKYSMMCSQVIPYIYGHFGYAFPLSKSSSDANAEINHGGILAAGGIGIRKNFARQNAFIFSVGYRYQKLRTNSDYNYYWGNPDYSVEKIDQLKRISITIGLLFNN
ncbi:MAG: hypothetical protein HXX13_07815 [Bacteroidetes bacterium]|nr:hypothetical protein [Bacteroidota bacterium]